MENFKKLKDEYCSLSQEAISEIKISDYLKKEGAEIQILPQTPLNESSRPIKINRTLAPWLKKIEADISLISLHKTILILGWDSGNSMESLSKSFPQHFFVFLEPDIELAAHLEKQSLLIKKCKSPIAFKDLNENKIFFHPLERLRKKSFSKRLLKTKILQDSFRSNKFYFLKPENLSSFEILFKEIKSWGIDAEILKEDKLNEIVSGILISFEAKSLPKVCPKLKKVICLLQNSKALPPENLPNSYLILAKPKALRSSIPTRILSNNLDAFSFLKTLYSFGLNT